MNGKHKTYRHRYESLNGKDKVKVKYGVNPLIRILHHLQR